MNKTPQAVIDAIRKHIPCDCVVGRGHSLSPHNLGCDYHLASFVIEALSKLDLVIVGQCGDCDYRRGVTSTTMDCRRGHEPGGDSWYCADFEPKGEKA